MITRLGSRSVSSFFGLGITAVSMQLGAQPPNDPAVHRTTPMGQISVDDGAASPIYAFSFGAQQPSLLGDLVTGRHLLKVSPPRSSSRT